MLSPEPLSLEGSLRQSPPGHLFSPYVARREKRATINPSQLLFLFRRRVLFFPGGKTLAQLRRKVRPQENERPVIGTQLSSPSCISRTDPRVRILCLFGLALIIAPLQELPACLLAFVLCCALLALSRPYLRPLASRLIAVNAFVLFLFVLLPLTVPGQAPLWLPLPVSEKGILLSLRIALKANALACAFMGLMACSEPSTIGYAMARLHFPTRLVFLFIFTIRFVHVLAKEWETMRNAARLRGFTLTFSRHGYTTLGCMLGMLVLRSHDRARRVHEAMLLRGFDGVFRSVTPFHARGGDGILACTVAAGCLALIFLEFFPLHL